MRTKMKVSLTAFAAVLVLATLLTATLLPSFMTAHAASQPTVPENTDDYVLEDTVVGGDFEVFDAGTAFGTATAATNFWGTNVAYDYAAQVVDESGNKVLKMAKGEGDRPYSSAFVFISSDFSIGDFMTVEFEYKLDVEDIEAYSKENLGSKNLQFGFAPSTGDEHHSISLDGTDPAFTTGANTWKWPVTFTEGDNGAGWRKVSVTLSVNAGTLVANSLRWLMPITAATAADDALLLDNVKILRWIDTRVEDLRPVLVSGENSTFNKKDAKDVTVVINTKGQTLSSIKRGGVNVNASAYSKKQEGNNVTVVFKKDYLSGLDNGTHTFTANTIEGTVDFNLTVEENKKAGCGSAAVGMTACVAVIALAGSSVLLIKKRKSVR